MIPLAHPSPYPSRIAMGSPVFAGLSGEPKQPRIRWSQYPPCEWAILSGKRGGPV